MLFSGSKTFTVFAPTDRAFASLSNEDITKTVSDRALARELIKKHVVPGTLYTNGMRYYQIKDSLEPNSQLTLSKTLSKYCFASFFLHSGCYLYQSIPEHVILHYVK